MQHRHPSFILTIHASVYTMAVLRSICAMTISTRMETTFGHSETTFGRMETTFGRNGSVPLCGVVIFKSSAWWEISKSSPEMMIAELELTISNHETDFIVITPDYYPCHRRLTEMAHNMPTAAP